MADETSADAFPPVLDAAQVARLLHLHIDYVRKLSREGVLPAHRLPGGRTFRYFRDDVLTWLREQPGARRTREETVEKPPSESPAQPSTDDAA